MLALTFATGVADAVGYLSLERVFVGNMTGNIVILGMGLAGANDLPVLGPTLALFGFMTGAAVCGWLIHSTHPAGWPWAAFVVTGVIEAACAALLLIFPTDFPPVWVTTALGVALGVQAAAARRLAVTDVTTVVITSTVTALSSDLIGGRGRGSGRRLAAIVLMLAGATCGALMAHWDASAGLTLAAVITATVGILGYVTFRASPPERS